MLNMFGIIFQGWGFCNKVCKEDYNIWVNRLRMVKLTILSDKMCKEIGNSPKDIHGEGEFVVNVRKELCGAFVNILNVTFVNYTKTTSVNFTTTSIDQNYTLKLITSKK